MCLHREYEDDVMVCMRTGELCQDEHEDEGTCEQATEPTQTDIAYQERRIAQGEV